MLPFIDPEDESRVGVFDFHLQIGEITRNRTREARHVGDWTFGALSFTGVQAKNARSSINFQGKDGISVCLLPAV